MNNRREKNSNPMPDVDEGWWDSVLADEGRLFPRAAGNQRGESQRTIKPSSGNEKAEPAVDASPKLSTADWQRLKQLYMQDAIVELLVTGYNRGGLLVEGSDLQGFVPLSHLLDMAGRDVNSHRDNELQTYVGKTLQLKVIECAPEDGRVVFSERAAQSESGKRTEIFSSLKPDQRVKGVVTNITDFGVFVDLGGVEGLIHISELSWGRVLHPSLITKIGSDIEVQVLDLSSERCRVALSLKRLHPNPWETAAVDFPVGSVHDAVVTSLLSYGAFARLGAGVEGLVHASEIPDLNGVSVKELLSEGQHVQVRVLHLDPSHQRMGLSMRLE